MSLQQVASCDLYVFIQFDTVTCHMDSNQFRFMWHGPLVWHACATCRCDNSVNKPITGLPSDMLQHQVPSCAMYVIVLWGHVASCDRTLAKHFNTNHKLFTEWLISVGMVDFTVFPQSIYWNGFDCHKSTRTNNICKNQSAQTYHVSNGVHWKEYMKYWEVLLYTSFGKITY